ASRAWSSRRRGHRSGRVLPSSRQCRGCSAGRSRSPQSSSTPRSSIAGSTCASASRPSPRRGTGRWGSSSRRATAWLATNWSAQEAGLNVRAVDYGTSDVAGGSFYGRGAPGTTRFVIDHDREVLVGATFTGAEVAEFVHAATIAIVGEVPLQRLWHSVPSFPTRSEVWLRLLENHGL